MSMIDDNDDHEDRDEAEQQLVPSAPAAEAAFEVFRNLLALVSNERAFKVRLAGIHKGLTALDEEKRKLVAAQTEFAEHETVTRAELAEQAAAIDKRRLVVHQAEGDLQRREGDLAADRAELNRQDHILKRRAMGIARMDPPGPLQDQPSWSVLVAELAGAGNDWLRSEPEFEGLTHTVEDAPAHLSVRQTTFQPRKAPRSSARRVEA
jgi:hypothetical protein